MFLLTLLLACGAPEAPQALPVDQAAPPASFTVTPLVAGEGATATVVGAPPGTEALLFASSTLSPGRTCPALIRPACLDMAGPVTLIARRPAQAGTVDLPFQVPLSASGRAVRLAAAVRGQQRAVALASTVSAVLDPHEDTDVDGLDNQTEVRLGTDPFDPDSDAGGVRDGLEVGLGADPLDGTDDPAGACALEADCQGTDWCADVACSSCGEVDCVPFCAGTCQARDWCTGDTDCAGGTHCSTSDGACEPDPSCPACDVCTGACVPDEPACVDSTACPAGEYCTTEDGACDPVTLCSADGVCVDVCTGACEPAPQCFDSTTCPVGEHCSIDDGACERAILCIPSGVCAEVCAGTCTPDVDVCVDSTACPAGEHCTTEDGTCDVLTLCSADGVCVDVCAGTCAPDPAAPIPCRRADVCASGMCSIDIFGCDPRFAPICAGVCLDPVSCVTSGDCAGGATCSTELGDCILRDCIPGVPCEPVCSGWCGPLP